MDCSFFLLFIGFHVCIWVNWIELAPLDDYHSCWLLYLKHLNLSANQPTDQAILIIGKARWKR